MFNAIIQKMNTYNCPRYLGGQNYNQKTISNRGEEINFMEEI